MAIQLEGYDFSKKSNIEIGEAFTKFSEYYEKEFAHSPKFYITRNGDSDTDYHIDISTSNPSHGVSSPIWVLFHFFDWLRLTNTLSDWTVAVANHVMHLHFYKETSQPKGYYVEVINMNPDVPYKYVFDKTDAKRDQTRSMYKALRLTALEEAAAESSQKNGNVFDEITSKIRLLISKRPILTFILVALVIAIGVYIWYRNNSMDD